MTGRRVPWQRGRRARWTRRLSLSKAYDRKDSRERRGCIQRGGCAPSLDAPPVRAGEIASLSPVRCALLFQVIQRYANRLYYKCGECTSCPPDCFLHLIYHFFGKPYALCRCCSRSRYLKLSHTPTSAPILENYINNQEESADTVYSRLFSLPIIRFIKYL